MGELVKSAEAAEEGYILVAEDNLVNQIVIEQTLLEGSREFLIVENGQMAIDAWRTKAPGLILMDVSMPVMNGLDAIGIIRREEAGTGLRTPVIVVSAHAMNSDKELAVEAGADDYLTKPISPDILLNAVEDQFHKAIYGTTKRMA